MREVKTGPIQRRLVDAPGRCVFDRYDVSPAEAWLPNPKGREGGRPAAAPPTPIWKFLPFK